MSVIEEIGFERNRQIVEEGWTPDHDDEHKSGQLAAAASCYAAAGSGYGWFDIDHLWPWEGKNWNPKDNRRDLIRAGALIVAEIERLDRAKDNG